MMNIQPLESLSDDDFDTLLRESLNEGYDFVQKLLDEFQAGVNAFNKPGELLLGVHRDGVLVAVGGVNIDSYLDNPQIGRIRHVYVLAAQRRTGVGRALMTALINHARHHFTVLTLRTLTKEGSAFYESLGFRTEPRYAQATHWLRLSDEG